MLNFRNFLKASIIVFSASFSWVTGVFLQKVNPGQGTEDVGLLQMGNNTEGTQIRDTS